jgi:DNA-binding SARP family transcriptional activator
MRRDVMSTTLQTPLRIALFGELRVQLGARAVTAELPGRQGRVLLAYLVLNRPRPIDRDELLNVLWPAEPPAAPEAALSSVLAKVRRVLGHGVITGREVLSLQLPPGAELDTQEVSDLVERAERVLAQRDPARAADVARAALAILGQPLLPGLQGDWVERWRGHFEELAPRALEVAARAGLALGGHELAAAERAASALVESHPFREGGYALLMEAQARRGDVAEALLTFDRLRVLLREELGASPSPSVGAFHARLLREGVGEPQDAPVAGTGRVFPLPAITSTAIDGAFVGREDCLARLHERWRESRAGQTRLVLLVGEAGVGKTRLAAQFAEQVQAEGGAVLYGRADEDALLPHQPFVEALRHLLAHGGERFLDDVDHERAILGRLLPDIAPLSEPPATVLAVGQDALRYRLFEAVAALLTRASRTWPLLLVLDDLHWADKPTLLLLRHLLRHPELAHLLVVGTFRHVEVGRDHPLVDILTDLRRERRYDRLTLGGLDEAETQTLVVDRLGVEGTPSFVRRLREQTEGNAFFLEETLRALADSGLPLEEAASENALERLGVPEGVAEVILRRVRNLSPLGAELLTAASAVGRDFRLGVVEQLVDAAPEQVLSALEESMAAGLVVELPDGLDVFAFSHALVREVLYGQLSTSRRVRLHHRVAEALEGLAGREPVAPAELAHHFALARHLAGPAPARRYAIAAGHRAADLLAYEEAVEHFRHALALFQDDDDAGRCDVLLALGRVQWHAGDSAARHTFLTAADSAARRGAAEQLARAALGLGERYWEAAYLGSRYRELLEEALATLPPGEDRLRALLLAKLAENLAFPSEEARAAQLSAESLALARRLGDRDALVAALLARHVALLDVRHLDERLALSDELVALDSPHRELSAEVHHWRLYDLLELGDLDGARRQQLQLDGLAKELRQPLFQSLAVGWRGVWGELTGNVALAERCAEEYLRHSQEAHSQDAVSTWAAKLFMLRRRQGRLAELTGVVERLAHGRARRAGWPAALALIHAEGGDEAAARALYERELGAGPEALPRGIYWLPTIALLSEVCAILRDGERARALYDALAPHAHRNLVVASSSFWGPVERYLALLAAAWGDRALATRHARAALARTRAIDAPLLAAELEARHADLLAA